MTYDNDMNEIKQDMKDIKANLSKLNKQLDVLIELKEIQMNIRSGLDYSGWKK